MADFSRLTSTSLWANAVFVLAGFAIPAVVRGMVEGEGSDTDLPDEVYGIVVAAASFVLLSGRMRTYVSAGAASHVVAKLLERFEVIQPVEFQFAN